MEQNENLYLYAQFPFKVVQGTFRSILYEDSIPIPSFVLLVLRDSPLYDG